MKLMIVFVKPEDKRTIRGLYRRYGWIGGWTQLFDGYRALIVDERIGHLERCLKL